MALPSDAHVPGDGVIYHEVRTSASNQTSACWCWFCFPVTPAGFAATAYIASIARKQHYLFQVGKLKLFAN